MADLKTINASNRFSILPTSNTADLPEVPRSIYVSVGGTLSMTDSTNTSTDFGTVAVGLIQVQPRRINTTGTTATVIGFY